MGGAFSLYLGISIAMVFEILELVFDLCYNVCVRRPSSVVGHAVRDRRSPSIFEVVTTKPNRF